MDLAALSEDQLLLRAATLRRFDPDHAWECVGELHRRGTRDTFARCAAMLRDADAGKRELAADVLGQLGTLTFPFKDETIPLLTTVLATETEPAVLASAVTALAHLDVPDAIDAIAAHATHPDASLRRAVAYALHMPSTPALSAAAIAALLALTADADDRVRDWATFSLGASEADSPAIRDALLARVDDLDEDTRSEALFGLARRRDVRGLVPLAQALAGDGVGTLEVEAAMELADPSLLPALESLREWWDIDTDLLESAIRACGGSSDSSR